MRAIASRLRPDQRFVAYGHRVSVAVLGPETSSDRDAIARGLALDVARWDQTGCLSPIAGYLVGLGDEDCSAFARAVADALESLSKTMPRGELPVSARALLSSERADARMRSASGRAMLFESRDAVVVLESGASARPAPLHRFLRLVPLPSLAAIPSALVELGAPLSNVAVAGFASSERAGLDRILEQLGASRITAPGRLQTPPIDWPRDGLPLFTPLARFVQRPD